MKRRRRGGHRRREALPQAEQCHSDSLKSRRKGPGGDFRSAECVAFFKQADIVVTNPPFSLFKEYIAQLVKHGKKFLIIGNKNAITYKEIFPLIKDNKAVDGRHDPNGDCVLSRS